MACSTFHQFSKLPFELRQLIWQSALRPSDDIPSGLHYFTLDRTSIAAPLSHTMKDTDPDRRSAYLWHAGLWLACQESREVVARYWFELHWPRFEESPALWRLGRILGFSATNFLDLNPRVARQQVDYEPRRLAFYRRKDLFCIISEDWLPLLQRKALIPKEIRNRIALEYNPDWNLELSSHEEFGPRDCFSPFVPLDYFSTSLSFALAILLNPTPRTGFGVSYIHLIDRKAQWKLKNTGQKPDKMFYDCKQEYITIDPFSSSTATCIEKHSPILEFITSIARVLNETRSRRLPQPWCDLVSDHFRDEPPLWFRRRLSVLVLGINQARKD